MGSIYTLMIDKISGKVVYAVMSFGGFSASVIATTRSMERAEVRHAPGRL